MAASQLIVSALVEPVNDTSHRDHAHVPPPTVNCRLSMDMATAIRSMALPLAPRNHGFSYHFMNTKILGKRLSVMAVTL